MWVIMSVESVNVCAGAKPGGKETWNENKGLLQEHVCVPYLVWVVPCQSFFSSKVHEIFTENSFSVCC